MEAFKREPKDVTGDDILNGRVPAYPLKFSEDLGPLLDKYEDAKKKNSPTKGKLITDTRKVVEKYGVEVAKAQMGATAKLALTKALNDINKALV